MSWTSSREEEACEFVFLAFSKFWNGVSYMPSSGEIELRMSMSFCFEVCAGVVPTSERSTSEARIESSSYKFVGYTPGPSNLFGLRGVSTRSCAEEPRFSSTSVFRTVFGS